MHDVKVLYKDIEPINDEFERAMDALMEGFGLERWASGFDYCDGVRDVAYDVPKQNQD